MPLNTQTFLNTQTQTHTMSAPTPFVCKSLSYLEDKHVMRIAHDSNVNVYAPDGTLFKVEHGNGGGARAHLYKPINSDYGILYVHNNIIYGDVALVANVVLNHELKLCAWGNGYMFGYTDMGALEEYDGHMLPQHFRRKNSVLHTFGGYELLEQAKSALKELFTGYKVINYSQKYHENMRKLSLKKASAIGSVLPEDMIEEVAMAHAPSWVFCPILSQLRRVHAFKLNALHKDFLWSFKKSKDHKLFYGVWHIAEVPQGSWKWFLAVVPLKNNVFIYMPALDLIEKVVEGQYILWEDMANFTHSRFI